MKRYDIECTIKEIDTEKLHNGVKKESIHLVDLAPSEANIISQSIKYIKQTQYALRAAGE